MRLGAAGDEADRGCKAASSAGPARAATRARDGLSSGAQHRLRRRAGRLRYRRAELDCTGQSRAQRLAGSGARSGRCPGARTMAPACRQQRRFHATGRLESRQLRGHRESRAIAWSCGGAKVARLLLLRGSARRSASLRPGASRPRKRLRQFLPLIAPRIATAYSLCYGFRCALPHRYLNR
jgi:hypothetical protein